MSQHWTASAYLTANSGTQWHSVAVRGTPRHSVALRGTPWHSVALRGTPWHSVALRGTQWHSVALRGTHSVALSVARPGNPWQSGSTPATWHGKPWQSGSTHVMYGRPRASQTAGGGRWRPFVPPAGPSRAPSRSSATWRAVASGSRPSRSARSMEQAYDQLRGIVWPMESSSGGDDEQISSS